MIKEVHNIKKSNKIIKNIWKPINLLQCSWYALQARNQNEEKLLSQAKSIAHRKQYAESAERREQPAAYSSAPILMGMIMGNKSGANGISQIDSLHNE